ncbi:fibronectin type III domain-containing protein [Candidatus Electronema sp. TJ]|uniref:fibronectin type III domain-containing protein n=1 Tax=Candidatus Electronema sp. TJ TaxID=3401573 RepID=UPI003AA94756
MTRPSSAQNMLAAWDFTGKGGQSSVAASVVSPDLAAAAAVGGGLIPDGFLTNSLAGRNQTAATLTEAIAADQYISFTLTPAAQQRIFITGINIRPVSQNRTRSFALFSSLKPFALGNQLAEFTASGIHQPLHQVKTEKNYIIRLPRITVAGKRGGLSSEEEPLEFRLYIYGHNDEHEAVGIGERQVGINEQDLIVIGEVSNSTADTQAPSVPTGLAASGITETGFTVSWNASTDNVGVASYEVFTGNTSRGTVNHPATSLDITGLTADTTYSVTVRAKDAAGNTSAASSPLSVKTAPATETGRVKQIGINTHLNIDYNIDKPFADAMRVHRSWDQIGSNAGANDAPRDANGWPTTDAACLVYHGLRTESNHGTYRLTFNGQAALSSGDASIANQSYNSAANTTTADLIIADPNNEQLFITFTSTKRTASSAVNTGVTNVRLMRPSAPGSATPYPPSTVITNEYLDRLAPFSCIRYMGWTHTNDGNEETTWATRIRWNNATIASANGKANWESVIVMANAANKDAWISIPHQVDDTFIQKLALMFKYGSDGSEPYSSAQANPVVPPLNPGLKLYVEYSNEIWNWGGPYPQTAWVRDQAVNFGAPLNFDGETDETTLLYRYKAMRTVQISTIFRSVFGTEMMSRVRPVLCWQQNYGDLTERTLSFIDRYYSRRDSRSDWNDPHPVNYYIYGGGGSAYWYTDGTTVMNSTNLWDNSGWNPATYQEILYNDMAWAKAYGLAYVLYEGDAHPTYSNNDESIMQQTHLDSRMNAETVEHVNASSALEGDLFFFLVLASWQDSNENYWGLINMDNPANSPQYDAVEALANQPAEQCSQGAVAPFTRPGAAFDCPRPQAGSSGFQVLTADTMEWDTFYAASYTFRTTTTGTFNVQVEYSTTAPATLVVEFAGNAIGTFNLPNTGGVAASTGQISISCTADKMYAIRTIAAAGSVTVRSVTVE